MEKYDISGNMLKVAPLQVAGILHPERHRLREMAEDAAFKADIERLVTIYTRMLEPKGYSRPVDIGLFRDIFAESLPAESPVYKAVSDWQGGEIFITTIGPEIEQSVKSLTENGNVEDSLLLNAIGSVLIESLADMVQEIWSGKMREKGIPENLRAVRYSPGYCGWSVKGQEALFGYMAGEKIPVSILPNGMMYPLKSVSGIMVFEKPDPAVHFVSACRHCLNRCSNIRTSGDQNRRYQP